MLEVYRSAMIASTHVLKPMRLDLCTSIYAHASASFLLRNYFVTN